MREVENLPFGPTARWTSLNLVGSFDRPPGCRTWLGAPVRSMRACKRASGMLTSLRSCKLENPVGTRRRQTRMAALGSESCCS